ncbi:sensor histidine kinase [Pseudoalteromonas sp. Cnat2-41]|uniref:sensor histidine kinase n=1 Tax=unclassified Pseudoalteromonas TaxID=194690 RepID=UPI001EF95644|nr:MULTISPECIES: sensor histidine kinase [unclassified Pseudoalteromonas]MCF2862074.1 sensor histidine kinase [Pseudoalteromonas sp. CNAT2-18]MCG7558157.1 sensor histidine kinase [Pseudoalteromonas sp. CNAT2-18.1]
MLYSYTIAQNQKPFWNWMPLIFSSFYFLPLIMASDYFSSAQIALAIVAYIVFVGLYGFALRVKGSKLVACVIAMLVLCIAATAITPGSQALFGFIAFLCGFHFIGWQGKAALVIILLGATLSGVVFAPVQLGYYLLPAVVVSIGIFFFGVFERRERQHARAKARSEQQIEHIGAVAERERIARDLHDLLGHSLSSIALKSELAQKMLDAKESERASVEINEVSQLARDLLSEVRQAVAGMKQMGLGGVLETITKNLQSQNIQCHVGPVPRLPSTIESALCFICKEAATNVIRHSKATHFGVEFKETDSYWQASMFDNGKETNVSFGNGLKGIQTRCEQLGGELDINTEQGVRLTCTFLK